MDPALQLQQEIVAKFASDCSPEELVTEPEGVDTFVFRYELFRYFLVVLNQLAVKLINECNDEDCPMMMATKDWEFRCAAHPEPHDCSAISYTMHTLHQAEQAVNNEKAFPMRSSVPETAVKRVVAQQSRRVYRIPAHAYHHHSELFKQFETQTHFMARFDHFLRHYKLVAEEQLIVPV
eukprot:m.4206 g.4206  ORF g.4206 m.4206 type:complete len:179 (-) comp6755_c0_seq1:237-773(-)